MGTSTKHVTYGTSFFLYVKKPINISRKQLYHNKTADCGYARTYMKLVFKVVHKLEVD